MSAKDHIHSVLISLLWLTFSIGLGAAALHAVKYTAITFHYYYGQHALLEPVAKALPPHVNPEHEGRLVQVRGLALPEGSLKDPAFGVYAKGIRMHRRVTGIPREDAGAPVQQAPQNPPEPYLTDKRFLSAARIGDYVLEGPGLFLMELSYSLHPMLSLMSLPEELRSRAEIENRTVVVRSANGFKYRVKFIVNKPKEATFIGRQVGHVLTTTNESLWRMELMKDHAAIPLLMALLNAGFFLLIAWACMYSACLTLNKALGIRSPRLGEIAWYTFLLACVSCLSMYGILIDKGVLWSNPTLDYPWLHVERIFMPGHFEPHREATAHACIVALMALCAGLALLPTLRRLLHKNGAKMR